MVAARGNATLESRLWNETWAAEPILQITSLLNSLKDGDSYQYIKQEENLGYIGLVNKKEWQMNTSNMLRRHGRANHQTATVA